MAKLAFYTCGLLRGSAGSDQVRRFFDLAPSIFQAATQSTGCIAHMMDQERGWPPAEQDWGVWGVYEVPGFFKEVPIELSDRISATISVWKDIEAVRRFAYGGLHAQALMLRREWFEELQFPQYVMWWVEDDE